MDGKGGAMAARDGLRVVLAAAAAVFGMAVVVPAGTALFPQDQAVEALPGRMVVVPADSGWVDTGIDVLAGETLVFQASGEINLQRGNPEAVCGPAGLDLVIGGQPVPDANIGALIGKVVQPVARRTDEDSGMEVRDEIFVLFLVGPENYMTVPIKGRLFLGVNENVLKDNGGAFSVVVFRRPT
jgi:hypothetical protein